MLVGLGAALFTLVGAYAFGGDDPARVPAQIVTGVGFLGAGAIFREGATVRGLTTAAGLWAVAAIGMTAGSGLLLGSFIATGIALVILLKWARGIGHGQDTCHDFVPLGERFLVGDRVANGDVARPIHRGEPGEEHDSPRPPGCRVRQGRPHRRL